ncbi:hypothetical protein [Rhodomicrobium sp.]|uniref:hypothetical protein n=1 Tax=Rhodomicrobium sp. TaxID=2720632 RepID=UPI0039E401FF
MTEEAKRRGARDVPRSEFNDAFRSVASEIGYLTREWNALQDSMATIFAVIMSPNNINIPLAVWNSTPSDRAQRDMLRSAVASWRMFNSKEDHTSDEIVWLLNEVDKLSNKRNDALHAPLHILLNTDSLEFSVEPNYWNNNPRAKNLKRKNVLSEFSKYRAQAECLGQYAIHIWVYLRSSKALPQRPKLPTSGSPSNSEKQTHLARQQ